MNNLENGGFRSQEEAEAAQAFGEQQKQDPVDQKMAEFDANVGLPQTPEQEASRKKFQEAYQQDEASGEAIMHDPERRQVFESQIRNLSHDITTISELAKQLDVKDRTDNLTYDARTLMESAQNSYKPAELEQAQDLIRRSVIILSQAEGGLRSKIERLQSNY